jgi:hypothetical protein
MWHGKVEYYVHGGQGGKRAEQRIFACKGMHRWEVMKKVHRFMRDFECAMYVVTIQQGPVAWALDE